ncbi:unnamed protein product [Heterobilharzia americana]|nr:unnamed protein product [Heterobilharzia americana]
MVIRSMLIGLLCLSITGIIFIWFTSNKSVSQCSLVDAICKDVYFRQCTRSRDLWLECIGKLNRLSKQQSPYLRELKSTWPPATITDLIDNQLPIINLALHIPFDKNAENPLNNKYYHEYLNLISNKSVHRDRNTWLSIFHGGMTEVGFSASNYALFPQTLNFQKVIHEVENGIPVKTLPINNPELLVLRLPKNVCNPNHTKNHLRRMTGGCVHGSSVVERPKSIDTISGIWALSFKEFPWKTFPPYFHGASYILGSNIVRHLAIVSAFTQSIHIDDAYLGILMNKLNIPPQHLNIFPLVAGKCDILSGAICVRSDISKRIMNWKTE